MAKILTSFVLFTVILLQAFVRADPLLHDEISGALREAFGDQAPAIEKRFMSLQIGNSVEISPSQFVRSGDVMVYIETATERERKALDIRIVSLGLTGVQIPD